MNLRTLPVLLAFLALASCSKSPAKLAPGEIDKHNQVFNGLPDFLEQHEAKHIDFIGSLPDCDLGEAESVDRAVSRMRQRVDPFQDCSHGVMNVLRHWKYSWPVKTESRNRSVEFKILITFSLPVDPHTLIFQYQDTNENRTFCECFESLIREEYNQRQLTIQHEPEA